MRSAAGASERTLASRRTPHKVLFVIPQERTLPESPMPKRRSRLFDWIITVAACCVLAAGAIAFFALHWHPVMVFWLVFVGLMLVGVPAGIRYGTQDKDYFWP